MAAVQFFFGKLNNSRTKDFFQMHSVATWFQCDQMVLVKSRPMPRKKLPKIASQYWLVFVVKMAYFGSSFWSKSCPKWYFVSVLTSLIAKKTYFWYSFWCKSCPKWQFLQNFNFKFSLKHKKLRFEPSFKNRPKSRQKFGRFGSK